MLSSGKCNMFPRRRFVSRNRNNSTREGATETANAIMGAEEQNHSQPEPEEQGKTANRMPQNRITQAEFLAWKRQKVSPGP